MDQSSVINIFQNALKIIVLVSAPMLLISLIVGIAVSIFQAATQIQEHTLTFIPKILSVIAALAIFGSWMLKTLVEFTQNIFMNVNEFIR